MKNNAVIKSWSLIKADRANQYKMKIHFLYSQIKRILTDTIPLSSVDRSSTLFHKLRLKAKRFEQNKRAYICIAEWRFYSCWRLRWHIYNHVRISFIITIIFATFISTCICVRVFECAILSSELVNWILPQKLPLTLWFHWEWFMRLFSADNEQRFIVIVVIFRKALRVFFFAPWFIVSLFRFLSLEIRMLSSHMCGYVIYHNINILIYLCVFYKSVSIIENSNLLIAKNRQNEFILLI